MRNKLVDLSSSIITGINYTRLMDVRYCYSWIVAFKWDSSLEGTLNVERCMNEDLNQTPLYFPVVADKVITGSSGTLQIVFTEIEPAPYLRVVITKTSGSATEVTCFFNMKGE